MKASIKTMFSSLGETIALILVINLTIHHRVTISDIILAPFVPSLEYHSKMFGSFVTSCSVNITAE